MTYNFYYFEYSIGKKYRWPYYIKNAKKIIFRAYFYYDSLKLLSFIIFYNNLNNVLLNLSLV